LVGIYFLPGAWLKNKFYRVVGWKIFFTGCLAGKYFLPGAWLEFFLQGGWWENIIYIPLLGMRRP
jgi:hypothetical protein